MYRNVRNMILTLNCLFNPNANWCWLKYFLFARLARLACYSPLSLCSSSLNTIVIILFICVDEAALVYMAYRCIDDPTYSKKESAALKFILDSQDEKGLFGNEYSTALAVQVYLVKYMFLHLFLCRTAIYPSEQNNECAN